MATSTSLATGAPAGDAFHTPPIPVPDGAPGDPIHARPPGQPGRRLSAHAARPLPGPGVGCGDDGLRGARNGYATAPAPVPLRPFRGHGRTRHRDGRPQAVPRGDRGAVRDRRALAGHSQGGQAALFAAHHAPGRVDGLAGVAAIAPANHLLGLVRGGATLDQVNSGFAFTPLLLAGALGGDPTIDPEQVLSPRAFQELWPHVQDRSRAGLNYRRYEPGTVPADEPLGIHFATIGHDTPGLTEWLAALLTAAGRPRG